MTRPGRISRQPLALVLSLCLALALAFLPLSPTTFSGGAEPPGAVLMAEDGAAPPCHGDTGGGCDDGAVHCAACLVLVLSPPLAGPAAPDLPSRVRDGTILSRALKAPGVPPGPPRLA